MRTAGEEIRHAVVRRGWSVGIGLAISQLLSISAAAAPANVGLLAAGAVAQGSYGTIKARLVWGGETVPTARVLEEKGKAQKDPDVCAKDQAILSHELEIDPQTKGVAYGFAYLVRPKGANPDAVPALLAKLPKVEMDQKNCDFLPHSLALHQDQTLVMKSSDPKTHNVRVTGFQNGYNQIVAANGQLQLKLVAERRPIKVGCDIHSWMSANLMVLDHPFFAVTATDGSFEIKGVPAGDQNLVVWQEKVGYVSPGGGAGMPVKVAAGELTDVGEIKVDPAKAAR
jgi:hypothetical protein